MTTVEKDVEVKNENETDETVLPPPAKLQLPKAQYRHPEAPNEWWWHVGTLKSKEDESRVFGFEINAALMENIPVPFAELMITDVANKKNYRCTEGFLLAGKDWAETDPSKPWKVVLQGGLQNTSVAMHEMDSNPLDMLVEASFTDAKTNLANKAHPACEITLELKNCNHKAPYALLVNGNGIQNFPKLSIPTNPNPYNCYNYYYSLTNLAAQGTIKIGDEKPVLVEGTTWMDHEYGYFPKGTKKKGVAWFFTAVQFKFPVGEFHFSNYGAPDDGSQFVAGKEFKSTISALNVATGKTQSWQTTTTLSGPFDVEYVDVQNQSKLEKLVFFRKCVIKNIEAGGMLPGKNLSIHSQISLDDQVFEGPVFEGVGVAELYVGEEKFEYAAGTAWLEQRFKQLASQK